MGKMVLPVRWLNEDAFYPNEDEFRPVLILNKMMKIMTSKNGRWSLVMP